MNVHRFQLARAGTRRRSFNKRGHGVNLLGPSHFQDAWPRNLEQEKSAISLKEGRTAGRCSIRRASSGHMGELPFHPQCSIPGFDTTVLRVDYINMERFWAIRK